MSPSKSLITPQAVVEYFTRQRGISVADLGVAPLAVITWSKTVAAELAATIGAEAAPHWLYTDRYPLYHGVHHGRRVCFLLAPVGAPGTIMLMEEMIACGARSIIGLGWMGSLQPDLHVGDIALPNRGISEEGTSGHYLEASQPRLVDPDLQAALGIAAGGQGLSPALGEVWTTDAVYRETIAKVDAFRQAGVLGVDMETAAMYAVGRYRGVAVANLLVVSDELRADWRPAFRTAELVTANRLAQQVVLDCLANLPVSDQAGSPA